MNTYNVIGIMSGTSLDGVDLAYCRFHFKGLWEFELIHTASVPYSTNWKQELSKAFYLNESELIQLTDEYGAFLGDLVYTFKEAISEPIDLIASHGHTIFHKPEQGFTLQIGNGDVIAQTCCLPVVSDFRSLDVQLGGQGAPLVPIGDKLLFSQYDYCINIGGFANISYEKNNKRMAFDICPANIVLNQLSQQAGFAFDNNGEIARSGKINSALLKQLNDLEYYHLAPPKSLGREWVETIILPILEESTISVQDLLRTYTQHICDQIILITSKKKKAQTLITGGGTHNSFLIELLKSNGLKYTPVSDSLIDFKEALVFAFLGVLRIRNESNCLSSVTGASRDSSGGRISHP